jgi:CO/xanthine dehydrogenase FAD-binding subunit
VAGPAVKPAPFDYAAPRALPDALALLENEDAIALAGGQSLVPMLNFRLARPELLVDLNALAELAHLRRSDGALRIGALTRQLALERDELVGREWPLLRQAVRTVAHPAIRSRGTVGGSVAHADPRAELPVALVALDARFHLMSSGGERTLSADGFFRGPLMTAREDHELLTEIEVPPPPRGARTAFLERANTHGNFAIAGAAVVLVPGEHAAIALLGAGPVPVRPAGAERAFMAGANPAEVAELSAAEVEDEYRRALIGELVRRAVESALA